MEIDTSKIKNKNIKGCLICQNAQLSKEVDPILFTAGMPLKTLKEKLENEHFIFLDISDMRNHMRHLFYDKDETVKEIDEVSAMTSVTNVDMTRNLIAKVTKHIKLLEDEGKGNTMEHQKLIKQYMELIELKSKLEGDLKITDVVTLPDWVRRAATEVDEKRCPKAAEPIVPEE